MPVGIQRINAKKSHPNERIVFIKPLKGPDEAIAQDFLERIAAQCLPIMREHSLSVMTLEEYEPNREFVGRNFNAGEVVQLVLKARSGHWLPFDYVQMVMMHELAHCKQMNHSRAFWAVRNQYADQMKVLWDRTYTGEGMWGRGALLSTGEFERNAVRPGEALPEHLCGGTYRSRRRKRKAKPTLTYQEQKERRILKKFGANGVALGEDAAVKRKLENGRTIAAKPRIAGSARGRELRAAAALARFDQQKKEEVETVKDEDETASEAESESGDDYEEVDEDVNAKDAVDINGSRLLDGKGRGMVRVCEDENPDDEDAQRELLELQSSMRRTSMAPATSSTRDENTYRSSQTGAKVKKTEETSVKITDDPVPKDKGKARRDDVALPSSGATHSLTDPLPRLKLSDAGEGAKRRRLCAICSFENEHLAITCSMCSNVLDPKNVPNSWSCQSAACETSAYLNAGDCGVCNVCGQRRPVEDG